MYHGESLVTQSQLACSPVPEVRSGVATTCVGDRVAPASCSIFCGGVVAEMGCCSGLAMYSSAVVAAEVASCSLVNHGLPFLYCGPRVGDCAWNQPECRRE